MSLQPFGQYFGRVADRWRAQSLMLSRVVHEHERALNSHGHEAAFVSLMLDGQYAETAARWSFRYAPFTAVYHPPGVEHQDVVGAPGVRLVMLEFDADLLDGIALQRTGLHSLSDLSGARPAWELLALYRSAMIDGEGLDFESRALQVIGDVVGLSSNVPRDLPSLCRARDYLHAHFRERVMMKSVADAAGIHPVYLGQMFHRDIGETIGNYVSRLRVRAAAERLCTTETPLAAVALEHGFYDQSHFQRVFKKLSGFTPAAFRSQFAPRQ